MKRNVQIKTLCVSTAALLLLAGSGCGRDNVKVYTVQTSDTAAPSLPPVTTPAASTTPAAMPATMPAGLPAPDTSGEPPLKYTLPAGWQEKALTQMRVASFGVSQNGKTADVSVIPLGGMAGGDAANVNRWRGQVGQAPLDADALGKLAEKIEVAGEPADLYDVAGSAPGRDDEQRILGVISHRDDTAWFFKMSGDSALVEAQKPAFISFLKSLAFGGLPAPSTMDLSQLPPSHPAIPGLNPTAQPATSSDVADQPTWTIPSGWQAGTLSQFLVAKFVIAGASSAKAEVNVSSLEGDGGGLAPNVNRWRAQLGQPPITDDEMAKLSTINASGAQATVVEVSGMNPRNGQPARLVGLVLPLGGQTWFYKLMGDADLVAQQKAALLNFVQSAKYPDAH